VVDRRGVALQHERVAAADRLQEPDVDLAVGEVGELGGGRLDAEAAGDLGAQFGMSPKATAPSRADEYDATNTTPAGEGRNRVTASNTTPVPNE